MANKPLDTQLLDHAIVFAVRAHAGTERCGKGSPYIVRPMEDKASHRWHYRGLVESLRELEGTFAFKEFEELVNKVFGYEGAQII